MKIFNNNIISFILHIYPKINHHPDEIKNFINFILIYMYTFQNYSIKFVQQSFFKLPKDNQTIILKKANEIKNHLFYNLYNINYYFIIINYYKIINLFNAI